MTLLEVEEEGWVSDPAWVLVSHPNLGINREKPGKTKRTMTLEVEEEGWVTLLGFWFRIPTRCYRPAAHHQPQWTLLQCYNVARLPLSQYIAYTGTSVAHNIHPGSEHPSIFYDLNQVFHFGIEHTVYYLIWTPESLFPDTCFMREFNNFWSWY